MTTAQQHAEPDEQDQELQDLLDESEGTNDVLVKKLRSTVTRLQKRLTTAGEEFRTRAESAERELVIYKAGLAEFSDKQVKAILANIDGDVTPEAAKQAAVDLGWIEAGEAESEQDDATKATIAAEERMSQAATGATPQGKAGVLTPADVGAMSHEQRQRLIANHGDVYEQLLQGNEVPRPAGF